MANFPLILLHKKPDRSLELSRITCVFLEGRAWSPRDSWKARDRQPLSLWLASLVLVKPRSTNQRTPSSDRGQSRQGQVHWVYSPRHESVWRRDKDLCLCLARQGIVAFYHDAPNVPNTDRVLPTPQSKTTNKETNRQDTEDRQTHTLQKYTRQINYVTHRHNILQAKCDKLLVNTLFDQIME